MPTIDGVTVDRAEIGTKVVFTSQQVRGLIVALPRSEEYRAEAAIRSALQMLERVRNTRSSIREVQEVRRERQCA